MFSFSTTIFVLLPIACVVYGVVRMSRIGRREPGLPPGPPTVPVLGNLPIFPKVQAWYKFTEWAKTYGDCYSLKIGPQNVIVLSSMAAVTEVLEVNSALTPSRPTSRVTDMVTDGLNFVLAPYGNNWRSMRRVAHLLLTPQACVKHIPVQKAETYQLMWDLIKKPKEFHNSVRRFTFSVTISVLYGKRIPQWNSPEFNAFFNMQGKWQAIMAPGAAPPVDILPILDYIPARWAPWKRAAEHVRELQKKLYGGLLEQSQRRLKAGSPNGCFVEGVLEKQKEFGITDPQLMRIGGVLIGAGAESTSSFINSLILAMVMNPEVLQHAQEEIDQVIGSDRLPTLSDVPNLRYVQAVISECHRWRPVNPICIPHAALEDVSYNGYVIPKGSTIIANNWGIFHDPKTFPDHEEFKPERFLDTSLAGSHAKTLDKDRKHHAGFGYGRRICPGVHLVDNSVNLSVVTLLWGFSINKAVDPETKKTIEPDVWNYSKGITTSPNAFECDIQPRSAQHVELLEHAFVGSTEIFQNYEHELCPEDRACVDGVRASF